MLKNEDVAQFGLQVDNDIFHEIIDKINGGTALAATLCKYDMANRGIDASRVCTGEGYTALIWCLSRSEYHLIEPLLLAGFDMNLPDAYGSTFFHWCVYRQELAILELGLKHGGDINMRNVKEGTTALHKAALDAFITRWLLEHGADINAQDNNGVTPLMRSIVEDEIDTMVQLLKYDPDMTLITRKGYNVWKVAEQCASLKYSDSKTAHLFLETYPKTA